MNATKWLAMIPMFLLSATARADSCIMCFIDGCSIVEANGFYNCTAQNSCSGSCIYKPPKPSDCFPGQFCPGGGWGSVKSEDNFSKSCSSQNTVSQLIASKGPSPVVSSIFDVDPVVAHALSKINSIAQAGRLQEVGAFAFALAENDTEKQLVIAGKSLSHEGKNTLFGYGTYRQIQSDQTSRLYEIDMFRAERSGLIYAGRQWTIRFTMDSSGEWKMASANASSVVPDVPVGFERIKDSDSFMRLPAKQPAPQLAPTVER